MFEINRSILSTIINIEIAIIIKTQLSKELLKLKYQIKKYKSWSGFKFHIFGNTLTLKEVSVDSYAFDI